MQVNQNTVTKQAHSNFSCCIGTPGKHLAVSVYEVSQPNSVTNKCTLSVLGPYLGPLYFIIQQKALLNCI